MKEFYKHLQVPLADELFECIQGPFQSTVKVDVEQGVAEYRYHTYDNIVIGSLKSPDTETTLKLAFEEYLKKLRSNCDSFWPAGALSKPKLFWRFRKGEHIMLEEEPDLRKERRTKLYTRLVVPASTLQMCPHCLHTEGEKHAVWCDNVVRTKHAQVQKP